jgi:hypothetical protein
MGQEQTTVVVQRYLNDLAGVSPAEPLIRALLDQAVRGCTCCAPPCSTGVTRVWRSRR